MSITQRLPLLDELEAWKRRYDALLKMMANQTAMQAQPPRMLADKESFEAGKAMAFNSAEYSIGIDTADGVHTVVVYRNVPGQPTTLVASARLPQAQEDDWK